MADIRGLEKNLLGAYPNGKGGATENLVAFAEKFGERASVARNGCVQRRHTLVLALTLL
jgi:hypothetical protein